MTRVRTQSEASSSGFSMKYVALAGFCLFVIILAGVAGASYAGEMTDLGGTVWQFDYEWTSLTVNDQDAPISTRDSPGTWTWDPDGEPTHTGGSTALENWEGLGPGVACTVSLVGRCDKNGNDAPSYDWEDPQQVSYNASGEIFYLYYYKFTVTLKTVADQFLSYIDPWNPNQNKRSTESGTVDISAKLRVILDRSIFSNTSFDAWFADAKILDDETSLDDFDLTDYIYALEPKIAKIQEVGSRIDFTNTQTITVNYTHTGDLLFRAKLTSGSTISGNDYLPFEVYITRKVMVGLLLHKPLAVGLGSEEKPDKPKPAPEPWWERLINWLTTYGWILIIAIILLLFCCICAGRGITINKVGG